MIRICNAIDKFELDAKRQQQRAVGWTWLTAHNWQKWKSAFLTCQCHEISRVEAVGLKKSNYAFKITIIVSM